MAVKVTVHNQSVPVAPEEAHDRMAAIVAILRKYQAYLVTPIDSPLTPIEIPAILDAKTQAGREP